MNDPVGLQELTGDDLTEVDLLHVVTDNYGICRDNAAQLIGLQSWAEIITGK